MIYTMPYIMEARMSDKAIAKVFMTGRSQAVRLPKEFRFAGKEVRISRTANGGVLLEPVNPKAEALWAAIRKITGGKWDVEIPEDPPLEPEDIFPDGFK